MSFWIMLGQQIRTTIYMAGFSQELVQQGVCSFFHLSFMIAGHTKFNVDQLFAKIAITYNKSDVFNCKDLASIVETCKSDHR